MRVPEDIQYVIRSIIDATDESDRRLFLRDPDNFFYIRYRVPREVDIRKYYNLLLHKALKEAIRADDLVAWEGFVLLDPKTDYAADIIYRNRNRIFPNITVPQPTSRVIEPTETELETFRTLVDIILLSDYPMRLLWEFLDIDSHIPEEMLQAITRRMHYLRR